MANKLVTLLINAKDGASDTLRRIGGALGGLRAQAGGAAEGAQNIGDAMFGAIAKANLLGFALNKVGEAAAIMGAKFEEAKQIEIGDVSAASTFTALTGQSFQESTKFVGDFSKEISKIAGALPGATADYNRVANSIIDNVIPAFKDANGVLDQGAFKENLIDITKKMTLLGVTSNTHAGAVGMFTARLLDGNIASARNLLFADNNPAFIALLQKEIEKRGKKMNEFKKFSAKERVEIVQAVSGKFVSKEVIDAASNTVEGLLAGINSSIFDPKSGVFGLLRDLTDAPGNQTVMTAIGGAIKGIQKFFGGIGNLLTALGVPSIDPMMAAYNGINKFTEFINQSADILGNMAGVAANQGGILQGLEALTKKYLSIDFLLPKFQGLFKNITAFLQPIFDRYLNIDNAKALINGAASGLSSIFNSIAAKMPAIISGATTAISGITNYLAPIVSKYLNPQILLNGVQFLLDKASEFIKGFFAWTANLSSNLLGQNGLNIIAGSGVGSYQIFSQMGKFMGELLNKVIFFIIDLPWSDIFITIGNVAITGIAALATAFTGMQVGILSAIIDTGKNLLIGLWQRYLEFFNTVWQTIFFTLNEIGTGIVAVGQGFLAQTGEKIASTFDGITNFFGGLWDWLMQSISQAIESAKQQITQMISQPLQAAGNAVSGATNFVQGVVSDPLGSAANTASSAMNAVGNFFNPPAYTGRIPTASGGLLGAFVTESRNMPSGATPVMANDSEFILTPAQMGRLMRGSAAIGATSQAPSSVSVGDIHIHGISNPAAIADAVIQEIEARLNNYQQSVLA